ncbi:sugar epimerase [Pontibacillus halophilus JSM 076056 = DSM 19796]|uniref:Sugar epimerase n=1 Tax=Pontibacillus halophilus JSM 076056 = DSM 19796 TaxID=1385510 RepID=A0A0A5GHJ3_9BACI|nr:SDR family oxidoreductase [Pontibacillus halophilus]KGX90560.1 sugar epimerase [Pontibacillus halophilus JSM 076056 = DSM 19796]
MNVLVIGANGQVGTHVVDKLKEAGHEPIAMVRNREQVSRFKDKGVKTVLGDLENEFEQAYHGAEAVVFAAGSGPNTGADKTILIDQEGAIKAMEHAQQYGVKRFVMLSSIAANTPEKGPDDLKHYLYAKGRADDYLRNQTNLDYTIVRPGGLTNEPGINEVEISENGVEFGNIPREDVASVMVQLLRNNSAVRKSYDLISGNTPISELVKS